MAQLIAITLANGQASPVNVSFRPASKAGSLSALRANIDGLKTSEQPTVSMQFRAETTKLPQKVSIKTTVPPLMSEMTADDTVDDVAVFLQIVSKENVSQARIDDALAYTISFLGTDLAREAVNDSLAPV